MARRPRKVQGPESDREVSGSQMPLFEAREEPGSRCDREVEDQVKSVPNSSSSWYQDESGSIGKSQESGKEGTVLAETAGSERKVVSKMNSLEKAHGAEYGQPDPAVDQFCELVAKIVARMAPRADPGKGER